MKKIKILHFTIGNKGGGRTKYALRIWDHIDKDKFQCDFATMCPQLDYAYKLENQGSKVHYISTYSEVNAYKFEEEINRILDNNYDVLHLHTSWWRGFDIENIAKARKVPKVIVHAHNTGVSDVSRISGMTRERAISLHETWKKQVTESIATDFWACSRNAAEWIFGDNLPEGTVKYIPNAIELDKFYYNGKVRANYRNKMNLNGKFVIGMIARFEYQKNHEFAMRVFNEIAQYVNNAVLLLIGTGDLESEIEKFVREKGLQDKVFFLGLRTDVAELLQAMDLFILPSRFDALAQSVVEAQATGLKCIVSNVFPEEAKITNNISLLALREEIWVEEILRWSNGYERFDTKQQLVSKGYDICKQIKNIENLYSDF